MIDNKEIIAGLENVKALCNDGSVNYQNIQRAINKLHENDTVIRQLLNRCKVLTKGTICIFCKFEKLCEESEVESE